MNLEKEKIKSGKGFDTSGSFMKSLIKTIAIIAVVIILSIVVYRITHFEEGVGGGQRNCILSVMGNAPDCSDNDGTLKTTYANGKYVGKCYGLDNSGNCIN